jgi:arabinofuranosyltransferase
MLADPDRQTRRVRATTLAIAANRRRIATLVVLMVPVILVLIMGWQRRWISDDGFINFRYVDQIRHGNGPVFNAGERVEAFTSPLWLALLLCVDLALPLRLEWIAVASGLALTAVGFVFAAAGATRLWHHVGGDGPTVPVGLLVFAALPPVWDFATSGLDGALGVAWLGTSWWALCRRIYSGAPRHEPSATTPAGTCVLIGLGPLVRPDLVIMTVAFLAVLVVSETSWRARGRVVAWALALPLAYEAFRMAYYAAIVPNTALAKEAGASDWARGWRYLLDTVQPYHLWIPLVLLVLLGLIPLLRSARARGSRLQVIAIAAPVAAGLAHTAYVVRVGGDFMHGRMLLPSLFCLLLPVDVVVIRSWRWAPALLLMPWVLLSAFELRPQSDGFYVTGISDERSWYAQHSGQSNPVTIDDYYQASNLSWARAGRDTRVVADGDERGLLLNGLEPSAHPLTLSDQFVDTPIVSVVPSVGMYSYAAGPDVFVVDLLGLSTAVGSRFQSVPPPPDWPRDGVAGHDKPHRAAWAVARYAPPAATETLEVRDARRSLDCAVVPELLDAVAGGFGPGRAWRNFWDSFTLTRFRLPESHKEAVRELCG